MLCFTCVTQDQLPAAVHRWLSKVSTRDRPGWQRDTGRGRRRIRVEDDKAGLVPDTTVQIGVTMLLPIDNAFSSKNFMGVGRNVGDVTGEEDDFNLSCRS